MYLERSLMSNIFLCSVPFYACDCPLKIKASPCVHNKFHFWTALLRHCGSKAQKPNYLSTFLELYSTNRIDKCTNCYCWHGYPCLRDTLKAYPGMILQELLKQCSLVIDMTGKKIWKIIKCSIWLLISAFVSSSLERSMWGLSIATKHQCEIFWKQLWEALAHKNNCSSDSEWGSQAVFALQVSMDPCGGFVCYGCYGLIWKGKTQKQLNNLKTYLADQC